MTNYTTHFRSAANVLLPLLTLVLACDRSTTSPVEPTSPTEVVALTGSLRVTTSTTGEIGALGEATYSMVLDGTRISQIGINKAVTLPELPNGEHTVRLDGPADGCTFIGSNEVSVTVTAGSEAIASFFVACSAVPNGPSSQDIAYVVGVDSAANIYVSYSDGTGRVQLTTESGWDGDPAWSPDGKQIAFASMRSGAKQIYVMNADGTNQVRLTRDFVEAAQPAWSPDGKKIAFAAYETGWSWYRIVVMNADGSAVTTLPGANIGNETSPDWSPDGKRIAYAGQFPGGEIDMLLGIGTMKPDGSDRRRVTSNYREDLMPAWSPDGTQIAFAQTLFYTTDIYIMNANGGGSRRLANARDAADPTWSPDGRKVAYGAFSPSNGFCWANPNCDLFIRIDAINGSSSVVLPAPGPAYDPTWRR